MNMEHMGQGTTEREESMLGNLIQVTLAERRGESIDEFIEKHASDFRKTVEQYPELLSEFETNPDSVLDKIIYH